MFTWTDKGCTYLRVKLNSYMAIVEYGQSVTSVNYPFHAAWHDQANLVKIYKIETLEDGTKWPRLSLCQVHRLYHSHEHTQLDWTTTCPQNHTGMAHLQWSWAITEAFRINHTPTVCVHVPLIRLIRITSHMYCAIRDYHPPSIV